MHGSDGCMKNLEIFSIAISLLLHAVQAENFFMHHDKLLIEASHGLSQSRYFTKY